MNELFGDLLEGFRITYLLIVLLTDSGQPIIFLIQWNLHTLLLASSKHGYLWEHSQRL